MNRLTWRMVEASLKPIMWSLTPNDEVSIGLCAEKPSVSELAHSNDIRQLDPFIGIRVDLKIPLVNELRVHAGQQGEVSCNHQALNVVGISIWRPRVSGQLLISLRTRHSPGSVTQIDSARISRCAR